MCSSSSNSANHLFEMVGGCDSSVVAQHDGFVVEVAGVFKNSRGLNFGLGDGYVGIGGEQSLKIESVLITQFQVQAHEQLIDLP